MKSKKLSLLKKKAALYSILTAVSLSIFKLTVYIFSGSLAILASAIDSISDGFISLCNYIAIKEADKPPDREHSYGHGKIEAMASFTQAILIIISGCYICYNAIKNFNNPPVITNANMAIAVMIISIIATYLLSKHLKITAEKTDSMVLKADNLHYTMDYWQNLIVIFSLLIVEYTKISTIDLIAGLGLAIYIIYSSYKIIKESFNILTDHELSNEIREQISTIIKQQTIIIDFHKLRTRKSGSQKFIDFHLVFQADISLKNAHAIAQKIIDTIENNISESHVMVHFDTN